MPINNKEHWETIYQTKNAEQVSWTQKVPQLSLDLIHALSLSKDAKIIDIGGGDSNLVDFLLMEQFKSIHALDISKTALEKSKNRLGDQANQVSWIECNVLDFVSEEKYDVWHDRASFHFLRTNEDIENYLKVIELHAPKFLIIATFSSTGPLKCSGLEITQYSEEKLEAVFEKNYELLNSRTETHLTPFGTNQDFIFALFKRREA